MNRPLKRLDHKPALRAEEVDAALETLRAELTDAAEQLADATAFGVTEESASRVDRAIPDLSEAAERALRRFLEDETVALVEPEGARGIAAHELHHEVLKKALVGLKGGLLRDIAAARGLAPRTKLDELARQVAEAYDWDEPAIARLVLDYAEDPRETEGGPSTRIFALTETADIDWLVDRLSYVDGRYYRTDIAKWFVFDDYRRAGSVLRVSGTLQAYRATVDPVVEGKLATNRDVFSAEIEVVEGSPLLLVHNAKTLSVAKAMVAAFRVATRAEVRNHVPNAESEAAIRPRHLHPSTLFLLDLITHGLRGNLFRDKNAILARFRLARTAEPGGREGSSKKASLRAVRFEGENLLDSPTACGLMWTEGRPLVDLTIEATAIESDGLDQTVSSQKVIPIRVAVDKNSVLVSTGLTTSDTTLVAEVHRAVVDQASKAVLTAVDEVREQRLVRNIRKQAEEPDVEADAQLLGEAEDLEVI